MGYDTSDDAAVYKIRDDLAMIQTVDFFTPIVDDPYTFGQIAAANSLSDVYAMGGMPKLAMNIMCVSSCMSLDTVSAILAGGYDKVLEAGALITGGHTIEDVEPKYGLCATGFVHPDAVMKNSDAQVGDLLILTKPLGMGILSTAAQAGELTDVEIKQMSDIMSTLNARAAEVMVDVGAHACTDVTGFGLLGHAYEMADGAKLTLEINTSELMVMPRAIELAKDGIIPEGAYRNMQYLKERTIFAANIPTYMQDIVADPQTSGGLLIAVAPEKAREMLAKLSDVCEQVKIIGVVSSKKERALSLL